jgi:Uncharacterised nucleotidyltransferase
VSRSLANTNAALESELCALLNAAFPVGALPLPPDALRGEEWTRLSEAAYQNGLTNMLLRAVEILARTDVPAPIVEKLRDTYRRNGLAQALAYRELESVLQECAGEKISVVVLKGAAVSKALYPEIALRPFGDLDVLIHRAEALRLREMLLAMGLHEAGVTHGFNLDLQGEMAFFPSRTQEFMLDLHWQLVAPTYYQQRMDLEWFWDRTEQFSFSASSALILNPTAQFVHLAAHVGLHHQDHVRLIWLYDLALLIMRRGTEIDWRAADAYASKAGLSRPLRAMLDATQARWRIALPPETQELFRASPFALTERAVYAVTTTRFPEARMLSDALSTPGMGHKLHFVRQQLFPGAAYMRTRYRMSNDALLPIYYARRVIESGFKFVRSLWAAMRHN